MRSVSSFVVVAGVALIGCTGNPYKQFHSHIKTALGQSIETVQRSCEKHCGSYGHGLVVRTGTMMNGNELYERVDRNTPEKRCIVLYEVNPQTRTVVAVGMKGDTEMCVRPG